MNAAVLALVLASPLPLLSPPAAAEAAWAQPAGPPPEWARAAPAPSGPGPPGPAGGGTWQAQGAGDPARLYVENPQSYPEVGGTWTVRFDARGGPADLVISGAEGTVIGADVAPAGGGAGPVVLPGHSGPGEASFEVLTPGRHSLLLEYGGASAHARNQAVPPVVVEYFPFVVRVNATEDILSAEVLSLSLGGRPVEPHGPGIEVDGRSAAFAFRPSATGYLEFDVRVVTASGEREVDESDLEGGPEYVFDQTDPALSARVSSGPVNTTISVESDQPIMIFSLAYLQVGDTVYRPHRVSSHGQTDRSIEYTFEHRTGDMTYVVLGYENRSGRQGQADNYGYPVFLDDASPPSLGGPVRVLQERGGPLVNVTVEAAFGEHILPRPPADELRRLSIDNGTGPVGLAAPSGHSAGASRAASDYNWTLSYTAGVRAEAGLDGPLSFEICAADLQGAERCVTEADGGGAVRVDARPPRLSASASQDTPGGEVVVDVRSDEPVASFALASMSVGGAEAAGVSNETGSQRATFRFDPARPGPLAFEVSAVDLAGNAGRVADDPGSRLAVTAAGGGSPGAGPDLIVHASASGGSAHISVFATGGSAGPVEFALASVSVGGQDVRGSTHAVYSSGFSTLYLVDSDASGPLAFRIEATGEGLTRHVTEDDLDLPIIVGVARPPELISGATMREGTVRVTVHADEPVDTFEVLSLQVGGRSVDHPPPTRGDRWMRLDMDPGGPGLLSFKIRATNHAGVSANTTDEHTLPFVVPRPGEGPPPASALASVVGGSLYIEAQSGEPAEFFLSLITVGGRAPAGGAPVVSSSETREVYRVAVSDPGHVEFTITAIGASGTAAITDLSLPAPVFVRAG